MTNSTDPGLSPIKRALQAVETMQAKLAAMESAQTEPIAIIGMGCRFPGGADSPEAFWDLLHQGKDAVKEVSAERWDADAYYDADPYAPGKVYTREAGLLDQIDRFDAQFFGISAREAASLDPQQRLLLEVSWEALENANQAAAQLFSSTTGVFVGICSNDYNKMIWEQSGAMGVDAFCATGNALSAAAGRLSHSLGLKGPSLSVDTACSSSLVAVHLACQSLRSQECELALAGGVHLLLSPDGSIAFARTQMLDERCKTFDAEANGYVRGEGCGTVVLKRLSDAKRDRDSILAVIRGSAVNHNGRSSSMVAPNGPAQQSVIQQALNAGKVNPLQVDYVEVQGTGTATGQPIEVGAITSIFCQDRPADQPLHIGSVKTNLGHLEGASGMASLIKTVLALQHEELPPHLHMQQPNPNIDWQNLPLQVPTQPTPWATSNRPRMAGINCFGFSGTNAHVVVQEARLAEVSEPPPEIDRPLDVLALSAKSPAALQALVAEYQAFLTQTDADIADVCFSANVGRSHFQYRLSVVGESSTAIAAQLAKITPSETPSPPPKVAFFFPHQSTLSGALGQDLYSTQPLFRMALDRCDAIAQVHLSAADGTKTAALMDMIAQGNLTPDTAAGRTAVFAVEYALYQVWRSWGIEPTCLVASGVGEYVAACVAGVFDLEEVLAKWINSQPLSSTDAAPSRYSIVQIAENHSPTLKEVGLSDTDVLLTMGTVTAGSSAWQSLLTMLSKLYSHGSTINWRGFDQGYTRRFVSLPTYPWQRSRHWIDSVERPRSESVGSPIGLPVIAFSAPQLIDKMKTTDLFSETEIQVLPKLIDWLNQQAIQPAMNGDNGNGNGNGVKILQKMDSEIGIAELSAPELSISEPSAPKVISKAEIQTWLIENIASELGVSPSDLNPKEPFDTYGLDSVLAIGIASAGKRAIGVEVTPLMLVHHPTIDLLSQHLADSFAATNSEVFEI